MSEFRTDPLFGTVSLVAAERAARPRRTRARPTHGETDASAGPCPLCPGNEALCPPEIDRVPDPEAPGRWRARAFPNRYPAVSLESAPGEDAEEFVRASPRELTAPPGYRPDGLAATAPGFGVHEVIVDGPSHVLPAWALDGEQAIGLIGLLQKRILSLHRDGRMLYIQVFKNHRDGSGGSLDHPHFQLVGLPFLPERLQRLARGGFPDDAGGGRCRVCRWLRQEMPEADHAREAPRFVAETTNFVALADFAPEYAYQVSIYPKRHHRAFEEMTSGEALELHSLLGTVIQRLERLLGEVPLNLLLFNRPNPRAFRLGAPTAAGAGVPHAYGEGFHWFLRITPRLGRHAGFELSTGLRMVHAAPEDVAERLRQGGAP
jgi:UDPglucose--hexose-1-phosphate uridylyltransferase